MSGFRPSRKPVSRKSGRNCLQTFVFGYELADHLLDVFRTCYGPVSCVVAALDAEQAAALEADILDLLEKANGAAAEASSFPARILKL